MFKSLKEAIKDGKEKGKQRGQERKDRARERFENAKDRTDEAGRRKELITGSGARPAKEQRDARLDRMGDLRDKFIEYEQRDGDVPEPDRRFEYETDELEPALVPYVGEYIDFRAKDGWELVRTFTHSDLGFDIDPSPIDDKLYLVFERPVDDHEQGRS